MQLISVRPDDPVTSLFGGKALVGVVHCPPLPGSPGYDGRPLAEIHDACLCDVEAYLDGGMNGLVIQTRHDEPRPEREGICPGTLACLSVITDRIVRAVDVPVGVHLQGFAPVAAIAAATAGGADFIRVHRWAGAQRWSEGCADGCRACADGCTDDGCAGECAGQAPHYRTALGVAGVKVFADSRAGHGDRAGAAGCRSIAQLARDLASLDADAMVLTGRDAADGATLAQFGGPGSPGGSSGPGGSNDPAGATALPLLVDAGVTPDNVAGILERTAGVIVAASLRRDGDWRNEVELERVLALTRAIERGRGNA